MQARVVAFVVWALVAASAMYWLLRLAASSPAAPGHTAAVATATLPRGDLTRVLGAAPPSAKAEPVAEPALASRFKLLGVAAPREGGERVGLALIAVDGKPARGYPVGSPVDGEIVLQSVHPRGAALGPRGAAPQLQLDLPPLPPPATGRPGGGVFVPPPLPGVVSPAGGPIAGVPAPIPVPPPPGVAQPTDAPPDAPPPVPGPATR
jgi:general secretion pathway protein C